MTSVVHGGAATRRLFFHNQKERVLDQRGRVAYLLELNRKHVGEFTNEEAVAARRRYRATHPTEIGVFKCMDGRVHVPSITQLPLGIIHSWRNLGGQFELGWPFCGHDVRQWLKRATQKAHPCLFLVTYHFSRGDANRGCSGFECDTQAAIAYTCRLKEQIERVFARDDCSMYAVQVGIDTDTDAIILHGDDGKVFDCSRVTEMTEQSLVTLLRQMYREMPARILLDFIPVILGNIKHSARIQAMQRPVAHVEHREWVLGVGRGFEWLNEINRALIVGPFSPNLDEPIMKAAGIIEDNFNAKRILEDGFVLLASASHHDSSGTNVALAEEEARFLFRFSVDAIEKTRPKLLDRMIPLIVTVDMNTRALRIIES